MVLWLEEQYPNDVGVLAAFLMNYVTLNPGEALCLGPNELHTYVSGDCIECMETSDNVVRAGLTPKQRDVETLCDMLTYKQALRLASLNRLKSGRIQILIATDLGNRWLDIPTVDLVKNYNIPSDPRDYVHRVGRTARAGRGGLALSFVTENDVELIHGIEAVVGKQLEEFECKEKDVLADITKVLIRMLPAYYKHVLTHEETLVTRFFGLHCVKVTESAQKKVSLR